MSNDLRYNWVVRDEVNECISNKDVIHDKDDLYSFINNEMGVVAKVISDITTHNLRQPDDCIQINKLSDAFPDLVFTYKGITYRAEIEYDLSNFKLHKHNPMECDIILYWINQNNITSLVPAYSIQDVTWIQQLPVFTEIDYLNKMIQFQDSVISSLNKDVTMLQQTILSLENKVNQSTVQANLVINNPSELRKAYIAIDTEIPNITLTDEEYYILSLLEYSVPTSLKTISYKTGFSYSKLITRQKDDKYYGILGWLINKGYVIESSRNNFELSAIPE